MSRSCTSQCCCINCDNSYGKRPLNPEQTSRKRRSHQWQGELPTQKRFAENRSHALREGVWSDFETIILQEIYNVQNTEDISAVFNNLVLYSKSCTCSEPLPENVIFREKSQAQITSKLGHLAKQVV